MYKILSVNNSFLNNNTWFCVDLFSARLDILGLQNGLSPFPVIGSIVSSSSTGFLEIDKGLIEISFNNMRHNSWQTLIESTKSFCMTLLYLQLASIPQVFILLLPILNRYEKKCSDAVNYDHCMDPIHTTFFEPLGAQSLVEEEDSLLENVCLLVSYFMLMGMTAYRSKKITQLLGSLIIFMENKFSYRSTENSVPKVIWIVHDEDDCVFQEQDDELKGIRLSIDFANEQFEIDIDTNLTPLKSNLNQSYLVNKDTDSASLKTNLNQLYLVDQVKTLFLKGLKTKLKSVLSSNQQQCFLLELLKERWVRNKRINQTIIDHLSNNNSAYEHINLSSLTLADSNCFEEEFLKSLKDYQLRLNRPKVTQRRANIVPIVQSTNSDLDLSQFTAELQSVFSNSLVYVHPKKKSGTTGSIYLVSNSSLTGAANGDQSAERCLKRALEFNRVKIINSSNVRIKPQKDGIMRQLGQLGQMDRALYDATLKNRFLYVVHPLGLFGNKRSLVGSQIRTLVHERVKYRLVVFYHDLNAQRILHQSY